MAPNRLAPLLEHCRLAVAQISQECALASQAEENPTNVDNSFAAGPACLGGCGQPLVSLLGRQAALTARLHGPPDSSPNSDASKPLSKEQKELLLKRLEDLVSISYSRFYAFLFKDLPACWRQLYTDASILKFCVLLHWSRLAQPDDVENSIKSKGTDEFEELLRPLDMALILAGAAGEQRGREWINGAIRLLEDVWKASGDRSGVAPAEEPRDDMVESGPGIKRLKLRDRTPQTSASSIATSASKWEALASFPATEPFTPPVANPVKRTQPPSLESFQEYLSRPPNRELGPAPLVISGLADDWPARTKRPWCKPAYLLSSTFGGRRLVPVEVGRSYVDEGWGQKLITFSELLEDYCLESMDEEDEGTRKLENRQHQQDVSQQPRKQNQKRPMLYLAQHPLLSQFPSLRADIRIPDLCYTSPPRHPIDPSQDQPELDEPLLNAWFGPQPGTVTPLHTDPYHNLLVQVVGRKYVRLYSPLEGRRLRPRGREGGVEMANTSQYDVGRAEGWDREEAGLDGAVEEDGDDEGVGGGRQVYDDDDDNKEKEEQDEFKKIPFVDCILEPGDTLYVPVGWWHYVRGLSTSFSVSFWWN